MLHYKQRYIRLRTEFKNREKKNLWYDYSNEVKRKRITWQKKDLFIIFRSLPQIRVQEEEILEYLCNAPIDTHGYEFENFTPIARWFGLATRHTEQVTVKQKPT